MIELGRYKIKYRDFQFAILSGYYLFLFAMNYTPPYWIFAVLFMGFEFMAMLLSKRGFFTFKMNIYLWYELSLLIFFSVHSYFLSEYPEQSFATLHTLYWNFAIFFFLANYLESLEDIERLLSVLIICVILTDIFIIIYTKGQGADGRMAHGMHRPIWYNAATYVSMEFSNISVYATLFSIYFYNKTKQFRRLFPIPLFVLVVVLSGSRKALVFLFISVFLYVLWEVGQNNIAKQIRIVSIAAVVLIVATLLVMKVPFLYNLVGYRFEGYVAGLVTGKYEETSANSRNTMKETAIALFLQEPIKGHGLDTFRKFPGSYGTWAHNNYLELLSGCGIFAIPIYYWYHILVLHNMWKRKTRSSLAKLFCVLVICMLIFDTISVTYMSRVEQPWLLLSAVVVAGLQKQECKKGEMYVAKI